MEDYYKKKFFLAKVDKNNRLLGKIERWQAHFEGILHRGFTTILVYKNRFLLQKRRHPAFDKFWDLTFSSHQTYIDGFPEKDLAAVYKSLSREWYLKKSDLVKKPQKLGTIYYKASDPQSIYTEHEIDSIYLAYLRKLPLSNPDFSYACKFASFTEIKKLALLPDFFAPWVKIMIKDLLSHLDTVYLTNSQKER